MHDPFYTIQNCMGACFFFLFGEFAVIPLCTTPFSILFCVTNHDSLPSQFLDSVFYLKSTRHTTNLFFLGLVLRKPNLCPSCRYKAQNEHSWWVFLVLVCHVPMNYIFYFFPIILTNKFLFLIKIWVRLLNYRAVFIMSFCGLDIYKINTKGVVFLRYSFIFKINPISFSARCYSIKFFFSSVCCAFRLGHKIKLQIPLS